MARRPHYDGPELPTWSNRIAAELANCRAALAWTLERGTAETAARLAGALWRVWWTQGHVSEGRAWLERALERREGVPAAFIAEALTGGAVLAAVQGDLEQAVGLAEELLARSQTEGYAYGIYWAFHLLGRLTTLRGHDDTATGFHEQALAVAPGIRNPQNHAALTLVGLAEIAQRRGDPAAAAARFGEALALSRQAGNPHTVALALAGLGNVAGERGDSRQAASLLRESLALRTELQDKPGITDALVGLAKVAVRSGQAELAVRLLAAAEDLREAGAWRLYGGTRTDAERSLAAARASLGEAAFAAAWAEGRGRPLAQIVADLADSVGDARPMATTAGLTPREGEVLRLLVEGRSDREIAEVLFVSRHTAANHVASILAKLGLPSRAAAAAYAVRHGLA